MNWGFLKFSVCVLVILNTLVSLGCATTAHSPERKQDPTSETRIQKTFDQFSQALEAHNRGDYREAVRLIEPLAEEGYALPQSLLAVAYESGLGVRQDFTKAFKWYREAGESGSAQAQYRLGEIYSDGMHSTGYSIREAAKWYRLAAEQGHPLSQGKLGSMYEWGRGVEIDWAEAARWYEKAAEQGQAISQYLLCQFYYQGKGVEKNYAKSYYWCELASGSQYHPRYKDDSSLYLDYLLPDVMSPPEINEAKRMAQGWRETHEEHNSKDMSDLASRDGKSFFKAVFKKNKEEIIKNQSPFAPGSIAYKYHGQYMEDIISMDEFYEYALNVKKKFGAETDLHEGQRSAIENWKLRILANIRKRITGEDGYVFLKVLFNVLELSDEKECAAIFLREDEGENLFLRKIGGLTEKEIETQFRLSAKYIKAEIRGDPFPEEVTQEMTKAVWSLLYEKMPFKELQKVDAVLNNLKRASDKDLCWTFKALLKGTLELEGAAQSFLIRSWFSEDALDPETETKGVRP